MNKSWEERTQGRDSYEHMFFDVIFIQNNNERHINSSESILETASLLHNARGKVCVHSPSPRTSRAEI